MIVYKYMTAKWAMQCLEKATLKLSTFNEVNDIFDCHPRVGFFDGVGYAIDTDGAFIEVFARSVGMISFSEDLNRPLLWSHYADSHRGIALGFEWPNADPLRKVVYSKEPARPIILIGPDKDDGEISECILNSLCTKESEWSYEREWRVFIRLEDRILTFQESGLWFTRISISWIKEVVMGPRCNIVPRMIWPHVCRGTKLTKASANAHKFTINLETIGYKQTDLKPKD